MPIGDSLKMGMLAVSRRVQFRGKARVLQLLGLGPGRNNRDIMFRELAVNVAEYNAESIREAGGTPAGFLELFADLGYALHRLRKPLAGAYRWRTLHRVEGHAELPALCDVIALPRSPSS